MICRVITQTGYKGQRYEVRALRPPMGSPIGESTEPFVVGWTDDPAGGALIQMVNRHPSWSAPKIIDLGADPFKRQPTE